MGLALVTPGVEPVTAAEAMANCRVTDGREQEQFDAWIKAARRMVEKRTGRSLCTATWRLDLDTFIYPAIELIRSPVQSIVSITYLDVNQVEQTFTDYLLDTTADVPYVAPVLYWPTQIYPYFNPAKVKVTWTAGYGAVDDVPETYKQAIMLQVAQWFEGRSDPGEFSMAAMSLIDLEWDGRY